MKKYFAAAALLSSVFLTACAPVDPNEPAHYINVATPAWAGRINVISVSKASARIRNAQGQYFNVMRGGTYIGDGLTARRTSYHLYITDKDGVECHWNSAEQLVSCTKTNPAYIEYKAKMEPK